MFHRFLKVQSVSSILYIQCICYYYSLPVIVCTWFIKNSILIHAVSDKLKIYNSNTDTYLMYPIWIGLCCSRPKLWSAFGKTRFQWGSPAGSPVHRRIGGPNGIGLMAHSFGETEAYDPTWALTLQLVGDIFGVTFGAHGGHVLAGRHRNVANGSCYVWRQACAMHTWLGELAQTNYNYQGINPREGTPFLAILPYFLLLHILTWSSECLWAAPSPMGLIGHTFCGSASGEGERINPKRVLEPPPHIWFPYSTSFRVFILRRYRASFFWVDRKNLRKQNHNLTTLYFQIRFQDNCEE